MYLVTKYVADKRIRLAKKFLKPNYLLLDAGCGDRYILNKLKCDVKKAIGIDIKTYCDAKMDITKLGFKDNTFDAITCFEVVEHCDCWEELFRVIKPGGILITSTPTPNSDWLRVILIKLRLLRDQDFEKHDHVVDLKKIKYKPFFYKKMFLHTSQFAVFGKGVS